ncbi:hypothetical protein BB561_001997 [Smittium simulii]|uniref:Brix domain-containing protein n=1 Tax=Smittium simulii TaxID=133385 RepID=A0A2T9YS55_9FUNG|nr:hypothetical protein BB561_001997 [Smittium simulii]
MGKARKRKRTQKPAEAKENVPRSFVVRFGKVGPAVNELVSDFRRVMEPNTASRLRERKNNKLRDYLMVAGQLGVSHIVLFSHSMVGTNMRLSTLPRGPALSFRVKQFSLAKDCRALQKTPKALGSEFKTPPLLILNNFGSQEEKGVQFKLMTAMFQNMFPAIDPLTMQLADVRRVVLLNYNDSTQTVEFRHYLVTVNVVGVSKGIKTLMQVSNNVAQSVNSSTNPLKKKLDLSQLNDIGEYILNQGYASDSEIEDNGESKVTLSQNYIGRGNRVSEQRSVKLVEIGPRMELELVKIEAGLFEGDIMYHKYIHKTAAEIEQIKRKKQRLLSEKAKRKKEQDANVARKKAEKDSKKKKQVGFADQDQTPTNSDDDSQTEDSENKLASQNYNSDTSEDGDEQADNSEYDDEFDGNILDQDMD